MTDITQAERLSYTMAVAVFVSVVALLFAGCWFFLGRAAAECVCGEVSK